MKILSKLLFLSLIISILNANDLRVNDEKRISTGELPIFKESTLPIIDTISYKLGYSHAIYSKTIDNGGVTGVLDPEVNGFANAFRVVLNNGQNPLFKPYVDMNAYIYKDRNFYMPTVGFRHDFSLEKKGIEPYASFGVGYAIMDRKIAPVVSAEAIDDKTVSANLTLEGGVDFYFSKNWALDLSLRVDSYNIETVVAGYYKLTTLEDRLSINLLGGIVYRFGAIQNHDGDDDEDGVINSRDYCINTPKNAAVDEFGCARDDDFDSVINLYDECKNTMAGAPVNEFGCARDDDKDSVINLYDRCPGTLIGVPVTECGCVPYKFDFALNYDYNKYKVEDILQRISYEPITFLNQYKKYKVKITGYADTQGSSKNNFKVSKMRAQEVKSFLIKKGISESRIKILYRGDTELDYDNNSKENQAKNRHIFVEFYRDDVRTIVIKDK